MFCLDQGVRIPGVRAHSGLDSTPPCTTSTWYADADGDGYGVAATEQDACDQPTGWVSSGDDCDDTRASVYPGAVEYCNGVDDDCDDTVDDNPADGSTWNVDADGDGYGAPMLACESPGVVLRCSPPAHFRCTPAGTAAVVKL